MDSRWIVREQIEALQRRLKRIEKAITAPANGGAAVESSLLDRVRLRFERRLLEQGEALDRARQRTFDPDYSTAECWDAFRPAQEDCKQLMGESLAVLEGALARSSGLDDGFCELADRLIAEISTYAERNWSRFTILDCGELYSQVADVIRIRFPSSGIWDLPVAAHECGHFVSTQVWRTDRGGTSHNDFQEFLTAQRAGAGSPLWRHLNEYFADVFATFAMGPAFALSALLLRFDHSRPHDSDADHPSPACRAYGILRTLDWMDPKPTRPFAGLSAMLREIWPEPDAQTCVAIDGYLDALHPMIERNFRLVRYQTWPAASALAESFDRPPRGADRPPLRDVLNAAWLLRMRGDDSVRLAAVEQAAAAWCAADKSRAAHA